MTALPPEFKYWAFISYSHADERWAARLHRAIETFRVPKALIGSRDTADAAPRPARLFPVFRDRDELPSASDLGDKLESALRASRNLIVVCSPNAVASRWVDEEIKAFKALGREARVFCLIVDGEPHASERPGAEAQECFPLSVRFRVGADRQLTGERAEPIAADARPNKDSRRDATLKLLSGVLDVGFDALKQRDQERRIRLYTVAVAVLAGLVLSFALLTWYATLKRDEAQREARAARAALSAQLATHSQLSLAQRPQRSLLLAVAALQVTGDRGEPRIGAAEEALRAALAHAGGSVLRGPAELAGPMAAVELSADGRWLAVASAGGSGARLWDLKADAGTAIELGAAASIAFSRDGRWLATAADASQPARLWNLSTLRPAPARDLPNAAAPLAFSPDGRWLVSGGSDRAVRLWNTADPKADALALAAQLNTRTVIAISPDSRWLATSSWNDRGTPGADASVAVLWDLGAPDPRATGRALAGGRASPSHLVFSPDGRWLATASEEFLARSFRFDADVRLVDLSRSGEPPAVLHGHTGRITALAVSADSRRLASGSQDGSIRVWPLDAADPGAAPVALPDRDQDVVGLAFGESNRLLFTLTGNKWRQTQPSVPTAAVWNLEAAERAAIDPATKTAGRPDVTLLPQVLSEDGRSVAVSAHKLGADGRHLLLAGGAALYLLDLAGADPIRNARTLRGHESTVHALAIAGGAVASVADDASVRVWNLAYARFSASPQVFPSDFGTGPELRSKDGRWLLTVGGAHEAAGPDRAAVLWDLRAPAARPVYLGGHADVILAAAISPDARWVATACNDGKARLWRLGADGPGAAPFVLAGHTDAVRSLAFSEDGRWLATGGQDRAVRLWDLALPGPSQAVRQMQLTDTVFHVRFAANRWLVASGNAPMVPTLWDLNARTAGRSARPLPGAEGYVNISPDGHWLFASGPDERHALRAEMQRSRDPAQRKQLDRRIATFSQSFALWDLRPEVPMSRPLERAGNAGLFSAGGRWLLTAGADKVTRLWPLQPPGAGPIELRANLDSASEFAFSADDRSLATSDNDDNVRLWNLAAKDIVEALRAVPPPLPAPARGSEGLAFAPDGRTLFAGGAGSALVGLDPLAPPVKLPGAPTRLSQPAFTDDGRWLIARDHSARALTLWATRLDELVRLACRTAGRDVSAEERLLYRVGEAGRPVCPQPPPR